MFKGFPIVALRGFQFGTAGLAKVSDNLKNNHTPCVPNHIGNPRVALGRLMRIALGPLEKCFRLSQAMLAFLGQFQTRKDWQHGLGQRWHSVSGFSLGRPRIGNMV